MKIFIINLKNSVERRLKMQSQMDELGLPFDFIEAVDGRSMSEEDINNVTSSINYAFLPGEIGCSLSHQLVYKKIVNEDLNSALILEDDVNIEKDIHFILEKINLSKNKPEAVLLSRVNKYLKKPIVNITHTHSLHKTQQATTAHSYIINKTAAASLLKGLSPIWMTADKWTLFEELSLLKTYCVIPHPVHLSEEASSSTINCHKGNDQLNSKKKEIWKQLMSKHSFRTKLKHRYRRAIVPIFNKIVDQGKG